MSEHNPSARYCVKAESVIDDTAECLACQEHYDLMMLDPDVQVIGPRPGAVGVVKPTGAELACRCDELTQLVADIKALHRRAIFTATGKPYCVHCRNREVEWPCPTVKLIEGKG